MQKFIDGIFGIGTSIYFQNILLISDIHLGYEDSLTNKGLFLPRFHFSDIVISLDNIFAKIGKKNIEKIILNGDIKHGFGKLSDTEWRFILKLIDKLLLKCDNIVIILGNHDSGLQALLKKRKVSFKQYEVVDDTLIIHGDKLDSNIEKIMEKLHLKKIIMGHEHPSISLQKDNRTEKFKCFLVGKWKKYHLIVMPSFNPTVEGTDVLREKSLSPFLKGSLSKFRVYIIGDEIYDFGIIEKLKDY